MCEPSELNHSEDYNVVGDLLIRLVDRSFEMEVARSESLNRQNSMLITCISIMSIAMATVLTLAVGNSSSSWMITLFALNGIVLLGGLCACIVAMIRKPYKVLASPKTLREDVDERLEQKCCVEIESELLAARHYADSLEESYTSLHEKNEFLRKANKTALVLLLFSCAISLVIVVYGCVIA